MATTIVSMKSWVAALRPIFDMQFTVQGWHKIKKDIYLCEPIPGAFWRVALTYTSYPWDGLVHVDAYLGIGHEVLEQLVAELIGKPFKKGDSEFISQRFASDLAYHVTKRDIRELWDEVFNKITRESKYYYAGSQRVAVRQNGSAQVNYLLGDHLGSTTLTTNQAGARLTELGYYQQGRSHSSRCHRLRWSWLVDDFAIRRSNTAYAGNLYEQTTRNQETFNDRQRRGGRRRR